MSAARAFVLGTAIALSLLLLMLFRRSPMSLSRQSPSSPSASGTAAPVPSPPRTPPSNVSYIVPKRPRLPSGAAVPDGPIPDFISVLTWNVWFGQLRQAERYSAIAAEVLKHDVDVACFQEVTSPFVTALTSSNAIMDRYDLSPNVIPRHSYGCLTIAKKVLNVTFEEMALPTRMGRSLIVAWMPTPLNGDVAVANVHLESLDNESLRRDQLAAANAALVGRGDDSSPLFDAAVLCGDFNFDSRQTWGDWRRDAPAKGPGELENGVLRREMPKWADAWPTLHDGDDGGGDPGITFDGATNPVCVRDERERMRYDRIMVKNGRKLASDEKSEGTVTTKMSSPSGLVMDDIIMVGTEPLDDSGLKPSDHYGLRIRLKLANR